MWPFRRKVRGNARATRAVYHVPDRWSLQAASLGVITNTFSPASAGIHSSGTSRGFSGDPGFGVNRWSGEDPLPRQNFHIPPAPIADPTARRLGIGAGAAGQPGMPSTGTTAGALGPLARMSYSPLGRTGWGG
jgi:hypothetical protein